MEKALMVRYGKEVLVSAAEVQREFGGRMPRGTSFFCPLCHQPLFPAAMGRGGAQSPHFRHERNNKRAQECENYAKNHGYHLSTYQRVPLPLFIRKSKSKEGLFVVEAGFRSLPAEVIRRLEMEGATLVVCRKQYKISPQRFGSGLAKIPIDRPSLNMGGRIRLKDTTASLLSTWGYPEDAKHAMVFSRDPYAECGKRLKIGDSIPYGSTLYLLAPNSERSAIKSAFRNSRKAGYVGDSVEGFFLGVYEVKLSMLPSEAGAQVRYLESCGFGVSERSDEPNLIWPPSIMADGGVSPLFGKSKCLFVANKESALEGKLFVHCEGDKPNCVRTLPLMPTKSVDVGCAILDNQNALSFVATRDWVHSSLILFRPETRDMSLSSPKTIDDIIDIREEGGRIVFTAKSRCEVLLLRRGRNVKTVPLDGATNKSLTVDPKKSDAIKVMTRLFASLDRLAVRQVLFRPEKAREEPDGFFSLKAKVVLEKHAPIDYARARSRAQGILGPKSCSVDKTRAMLRRTSK